MAIDHWTNKQLPSMKWRVSDFFPSGQGPEEHLQWVYDPTVVVIVEGEDEGWSSLMLRYTAKIRNLGFHYALERAAISIIINLIPSFSGVLSARFKQRVSSLFDMASEYLSDTDDVLVLSDIFSLGLQKIVKGNLFRALLDDAQGDAQSIEEWSDKAALFLGWAGAEDWRRRQIWNETVFAELGWPITLQLRAYPGPTEAPIRPDLLTALCLLGKHDHSNELIDLGYELNGFLLFNFQSSIWRRTGRGPATLDEAADYFERAEVFLDQAATGQVSPLVTDKWRYYVWQQAQEKDRDPPRVELTIEECNALRLLHLLANRSGLNVQTGIAVAAALHYQVRTAELSFPDYIPSDSDSDTDTGI